MDEFGHPEDVMEEFFELWPKRLLPDKEQLKEEITRLWMSDTYKLIDKGYGEDK